jgi:hypothetical protein
MAGSNSDPRNCPKKKQSKCHLTRLTFVFISFEFFGGFLLFTCERSKGT